MATRPSNDFFPLSIRFAAQADQDFGPGVETWGAFVTGGSRERFSAMTGRELSVGAFVVVDAEDELQFVDLDTSDGETLVRSMRMMASRLFGASDAEIAEMRIADRDIDDLRRSLAGPIDQAIEDLQNVLAFGAALAEPARTVAETDAPRDPIVRERPSEHFLPARLFRAESFGDDGYRAQQTLVETWGCFVTAANRDQVGGEEGEFVLLGADGEMLRADIAGPGEDNFNDRFKGVASAAAGTDGDCALALMVGDTPVRLWGVASTKSALDRLDDEEAGWNVNFSGWLDVAMARAANLPLDEQRDLTMLSIARVGEQVDDRMRQVMERAPADAQYRALLSDIAGMRRDVANAVAPFVRIDRPVLENLRVAREVAPQIGDRLASAAWRPAVTPGHDAAAMVGADALVRDLFAQVTLQAPSSILAMMERVGSDAAGEVGQAFAQMRDRQGEPLDPAWEQAALRNMQGVLNERGLTRLGYRADIEFALAGDMTFMKVADPHAIAVYAWPQATLRPLADIDGNIALPTTPVERSPAQIERLSAILSVVRRDVAAAQIDAARRADLEARDEGVAQDPDALAAVAAQLREGPRQAMPVADILREAETLAVDMAARRLAAEQTVEPRRSAPLSVVGLGEYEDDEDDEDHPDHEV